METKQLDAQTITAISNENKSHLQSSLEFKIFRKAISRNSVRFLFTRVFEFYALSWMEHHIFHVISKGWHTWCRSQEFDAQWSQSSVTISRCSARYVAYILPTEFQVRAWLRNYITFFTDIIICSCQDEMAVSLKRHLAYIPLDKMAAILADDIFKCILLESKWFKFWFKFRLNWFSGFGWWFGAE